MKQGLSPQLAIPKHDHGGGTPLGCLRHSVLLLLTTNDTLEISQANKVRTKFAKSQTGRWLLATNNKSFSFFSAVDNCRMLICGLQPPRTAHCLRGIMLPFLPHPVLPFFHILQPHNLALAVWLCL